MSVSRRVLLCNFVQFSLRCRNSIDKFVSVSVCVCLCVPNSSIPLDICIITCDISILQKKKQKKGEKKKLGNIYRREKKRKIEKVRDKKKNRYGRILV